MSHEDPQPVADGNAPGKSPWEPMKLTCIGHVGEVLQGGGGKLPTAAADKGDIYKPKGGGGEK